jgi:RHS repeat-associated protein
MLPASRHLLPVIGIDIHMIIILGAPVPVPHPFIGLVFDPMDWVPKIGASVKVNGIPRANSGTNGMLGSKVHIPMGGPFAMAPTIGHDSMNVFGSTRVKAEGSYFSGGGFMVMSCNDIGMPLSITPGKKFKPIPTLYLPTSVSIPIPGGKPVIVGGPYAPDLMGILMGLVMSFGFGALMKIGGKALKKALTALNHGVLKKFKCTKGLSKKFCKHGFEPVNLVTGSVLYEGVDFEIPGIIPIKWERNWYSDSGYEGLLGHGTHLCYDLTLQVWEEDNMIGVILPDGRACGFPLLVNSKESFYHRPEKLTLTCKDFDHYELTDHNKRLTYSFKRQHENIFKPTQLANHSGVSIKFRYNSSKILHGIIDTAGRNILIEHDEFHRITKVEAEHRGSKRLYVEYGYNSAGDLIAITDALGKTTTIRYENHLMVQKTDRNGQSFYWEYEGFKTGAKCIHTYGDGGLLEGRIDYKEGFNVVTNSIGESKLYYFDENGLCIQETDELGHSVYTEYTDNGELGRYIDEEGNITGYIYDQRGNMTAVQLPDGTAKKFTYDKEDQIISTSDAEGNDTIYVNQRRNVKAVIKPEGAVTSFEYYENGLIQTSKDCNGQATLFNYDEDNNLTSLILPDNTKATWIYDEWGRCIKNINPETQSQSFQFDALDRLTEIRKYDGNKVKLTYNAYGEVIYAKDAQQRLKFEYTPLGNLLSREANGSRVTFNYDTEERLTSVSNEYHEMYWFAYDKKGRLIKEVGFDGLVRYYTRDRSGKIIKVIRPGSRHSEYEYDLGGRLVRAEYSDGSWEIYDYNKNGEVISAINENSQVILTREGDRVIKEQQDEHTVESMYDSFGRRIHVKSSLGASITMLRNLTGQVEELTAANKEGVEWKATFRYNAVNQEIERILPGGLISSFEYDHSGRAVCHKVRSKNGSTRHRSYSWDVNDRLQSMMDGLNTGSVKYGHNDFGSLAWVKYEDGQYDFRVPDMVGNLYKTENRKDRHYGPGGRLLQNNGTIYQYDEEGNLISKILPDGKFWAFQWSANGTLKKVIRPDSKEVSFEYDALGRRTAKIFNGTITRWIWDGNTPLHEWKYSIDFHPGTIINNSGEIMREKGESTKDLITWVFTADSFKPAAKITDERTQSVITDYLGTPVEMYDSKGEKSWHAEYDSYGHIRNQRVGVTEECPFRYQGQYQDEETNLYYNRYRYYSPEDGAYISCDPILIEGGLNVYAYVADPTLLIDVFGLEPAAPGTVLYHYTNEAGMNAIVESNSLNPSLKEVNPRDARYGNGQYLSDLKPGTKTPAQLGHEFINVPNKHKFTHFVAIDVSGLDVVKGRDGVFVIKGEHPLDLNGRIVGAGKVVCK